MIYSVKFDILLQFNIHRQFHINKSLIIIIIIINVKPAKTKSTQIDLDTMINLLTLVRASVQW